MKKIFILFLPLLMAVGCSKDNEVKDVDISQITGSYQIDGFRRESKLFCTQVNVLFYDDCVTARDGREYCRMGELIINADSTVSAILNSDFGYNFVYPNGEVLISGNKATICLEDGKCQEFRVKNDGIYLEYKYEAGIFLCKTTIRLKRG